MCFIYKNFIAQSIAIVEMRKEQAAYGDVVELYFGAVRRSGSRSLPHAKLAAQLPQTGTL